ncbi:MAG: glycosyltransferase family 2 protein [Halobacteriota archaeon]
MKSPKVSIIILNWNGWEDTIECLESLYQITYPNSEAFFVNALPQRAGKGCYDVIVVDNGSEDDSIEKIKEYAEGKIKVESKFFEYSDKNKPIKFIEYTRERTEAEGSKEKEITELPSNRKLILIKNEKNYGFAEGNNIGMRYALKSLNPDYVLLLNNDTVVDKVFLSELIEIIESDEKIGIAGPKMYYYNYNGKDDVIWFAGGKINLWRDMVYFHIGLNEQDLGQYDTFKEVDWISGSALMLKSIVIKKLSLLNSKYFFGNEDVEYCLKLRRQGVKVVFVPTSKVWHKVGVSRAKTAKIRDIQAYFNFIKENFPRFVYAYHILLLSLITLPMWGLIYIFKYRDKETFRKAILYIKSLFKMLTNSK